MGKKDGDSSSCEKFGSFYLKTRPFKYDKWLNFQYFNVRESPYPEKNTFFLTD